MADDTYLQFIPSHPMAQTAATGGILLAILNYAPTVIGILAGLLGCVYYTLLIMKEFTLRRQERARQTVLDGIEAADTKDKLSRV